MFSSNSRQKLSHVCSTCKVNKSGSVVTSKLAVLTKGGGYLKQMSSLRRARESSSRFYSLMPQSIASLDNGKTTKTEEEAKGKSTNVTQQKNHLLASMIDFKMGGNLTFSEGFHTLQTLEHGIALSLTKVILLSSSKFFEIKDFFF